MEIHYSIILVSDMKQSVAFYKDVVGMPLRFESPNWSEFATGGATRVAQYVDPDGLVFSVGQGGHDADSTRV